MLIKMHGGKGMKELRGFLAVFSMIGLFMVSSISVFAYSPRTSAPERNESYYYNQSYNPYAGRFVGECTWYVWGRAYEILGVKPTYGPNSGKDIWGNCAGKYERGSTPKVGAIACWGANPQSSAGHVAIVEKIENGVVYTSEYNRDFRHNFFYERMINMSNFQGYVYLYQEPELPVDTEKPIVSNVYTENKDNGGYNIVCNVNDNVGIAKVIYSVWREGSNEEPRKLLGTIINGNIANVRVNFSDFGYAEGIYHAEINAYDENNNIGTYSGIASDVVLDRTAPEISNVYTEYLSSEGYNIVCNVNDNIQVGEVICRVWREGSSEESKNIKGVIVNGNIANVRINISDFGNIEGKYHANIYAYDTSRNEAIYSGNDCTVYIDRTPPQLQNVKITDIDSTGYTVTCEATDKFEIDRVQFPTWTAYNNTDDLPPNWNVTPNCSGSRNGNIFSYRVKDSDHNFERGKYITDIYAFDKMGNTALKEIEVNVQNKYQAKSSITYNGSKYSLYEDILNWDQAKIQAEKLGGHLATITSKGEQDAIASLISKGSRGGYFLGATDKQSKGNFKWVTGEVFEFSNWANGEPNNDGGIEDSLEISRTNYVWNDIPNNTGGNYNRGFILESKITYNVSSVALSQQYISFNKKGSVTSLSATILPSNANNKTVIWKSSNTSVATVSNGKVTAVGNGTANITVTTQNGNKTASCKVTVNIPKTVVKVTGVSLNQKEVTLTAKGKTLKLNAQVMPSAAANKNVTWKSSKTHVVTVDQKGTVTARGNGTANITVTTADGNKTATCKIMVKIPAPVKVTAKSVSLNKSSITLYKGKTYTLKAKVTPSNYKSGVSWLSSNRNASVSKDGKVTANKAGKSTITVKTNNNKRAYCNVVVKEIKSKSVSLNKRSITIYRGKKYTLKATVKPANSTDGKSWSTSNKKYATVTSKGTITAMRKGSCTITVKTSSGKKAVCKVTIK